METKTDLEKQLTKVFENFISEFNKVSPELVNAEQKPGSWTIGQLAQHIILATAGIPDGKNKQSDRPADQLEPSIRETFLDYTRKFEAQEFITPEKKNYDKEALQSKLKNNQELLLQIIKGKELDYLCLDMELPGWKYLTRYEWIKLIIYHVERHIKQLKRLKIDSVIVSS